MKNSQPLHATTTPKLPNYHQRSNVFRHQATATFAEMSIDPEAQGIQSLSRLQWSFQKRYLEESCLLSRLDTEILLNSLTAV